MTAGKLCTRHVRGTEPGQVVYYLRSCPRCRQFLSDHPSLAKAENIVDKMPDVGGTAGAIAYGRGQWVDGARMKKVNTAKRAANLATLPPRRGFA